MKAFKRFFICAGLITIMSLLSLFYVAGATSHAEMDEIMINDILETAKENWDDLSALEDKEFGYEMLILDSDNQKLYESSAEIFKNVNAPRDAVKDNMIVMPINDGEIFYGTLVVPSPTKISYKKTIHKLFAIAFIATFILLMSYAAFIYYTNRNIIKPFDRMKKFAALVAMGNLDEPLLMDENNVFGAFTESFDIMREELKAARERETALKMKEKELVASLSHDLKTPVTGIRTICGVLSVKVQDEYVKAKIDNIEQKTQEISTLLNDLLASALDDLGQMNVVLTEETSDVILEIINEHDIYGKAEIDKIPDCIIKIDRNRMSQVIGNIINNSYKYADTQIDVGFKFGGTFLEMKIRDHGKGVEPEEIDFLTNKFYRGKNNAAGKEGSGLGLYISSELMKKMGGSLICISDKYGFEVVIKIKLA